MIIHGVFPTNNGTADPFDGGSFVVSGTVKIAGVPETPVAYRVFLMEPLSKRVVRTTLSDAATGDYAFQHVRAGPWLIMCDDPTGSYDPVAVTNKYGDAE